MHNEIKLTKFEFKNSKSFKAVFIILLLFYDLVARTSMKMKGGINPRIVSNTMVLKNM